MSHVIASDAHFTDLESLKAACARLGLEFVEGQETFKWYGRHVGDYPLPEGFTKADMGHCEHAIRIPGNGEAYEIGVVSARKEDQEGHVLMFDFFMRGYGMEDVAGARCNGLIDEYIKVLADEHMPMWLQEEEILEDGSMVLTLEM